MSTKSDPPLVLPAEWHPHKATWLAWNFPESYYPEESARAAIYESYLAFIAALSRYEPVNILVPFGVNHSALFDEVARVGGIPSRCCFHQANFYEPFLRDSGPTWVYRGGEKVALQWRFSGWGLFPVEGGDDEIAATVGALSGSPVLNPCRVDGVTRFVCEGGAFDSDGAGTLIVTEECLLSTEQERNPGATREEYEAVFAKWLGTKQVIWLGGGAAGDDTHGHVDDIARFVAPRTVMLAVSHDPKSANYQSSQDNLARLQVARDADHKLLEVVELPFPEGIRINGEVVPASYANFCFVDGAVVVPVFKIPADEVAIGVFEKVFPDRKIEPVYSTPFLYGSGALHCLSQQEPG